MKVITNLLTRINMKHILILVLLLGSLISNAQDMKNFTEHLSCTTVKFNSDKDCNMNTFIRLYSFETRNDTMYFVPQFNSIHYYVEVLGAVKNHFEYIIKNLKSTDYEPIYLPYSFAGNVVRFNTDIEYYECIIGVTFIVKYDKVKKRHSVVLHTNELNLVGANTGTKLKHKGAFILFSTPEDIQELIDVYHINKLNDMCELTKKYFKIMHGN